MTSEKPKVLLVDDEAHILKTMGICFEDLDFAITKCQDSQEALKLVTLSGASVAGSSVMWTADPPVRDHVTRQASQSRTVAAQCFERALRG